MNFKFKEMDWERLTKFHNLKRMNFRWSKCGSFHNFYLDITRLTTLETIAVNVVESCLGDATLRLPQIKKLVVSEEDNASHNSLTLFGPHPNLETLETTIPWCHNVGFEKLTHLHACLPLDGVEGMIDNFSFLENLTVIDYFLDAVGASLSWSRKQLSKIIGTLKKLRAICVPLEESNDVFEFETVSLKIIGLHVCGDRLSKWEIETLTNKGILVCLGHDFEMNAGMKWELHIHNGCL